MFELINGAEKAQMCSKNVVASFLLFLSAGDWINDLIKSWSAGDKSQFVLCSILPSGLSQTSNILT